MKYWKQNVTHIRVEESSRIITSENKKTLQDLLKVSKKINETVRDKVEALLRTAKTVSSNNIPCNVITLDSELRLLDTSTNSYLKTTLVLPKKDKNKGTLSVLSCLGISLLGRQANEEFAYETRSRITQIKIARILYQPEAFGGW